MRQLVRFGDVLAGSLVLPHERMQQEAFIQGLRILRVGQDDPVTALEGLVEVIQVNPVEAIPHLQASLG